MPATADAPASLTARFTLKLGGRPLEFTVTVPTEPITLAELIPSIREFQQQLIDHAVIGEKAKKRAVSCQAGCGACCCQLVPVSPTEAAILREWVANRSPEEAEAIHQRFQSVNEGLEEAGLQERLQTRGNIRSPEEMRQLGLAYFMAKQPCPFLVDQSCSAYEVRPMKCREYLVTSPSANCATPGPNNIQMVDFPVSFIKILLQLELWLTGKPPRWLPLNLLFSEEAEETAGETEQPRRPGTELFERFLGEFVRHGTVS